MNVHRFPTLAAPRRSAATPWAVPTAALLAASLAGCAAGNAPRETAVQTPTSGATSEVSSAPSSSAAPTAVGCPKAPEQSAGSGLASQFAGYFPVGVAVTRRHLTSVPDLLTAEFNHLTPENDLKFANVHPAENSYSFTAVDAIADFARSHQMKLTGHTFVWHRQYPAWLFKELTPLDPASIEILKGRLKAHIETLVARYADVVSNWDVVNEAISDDPSKILRDTAEGSEWFHYFGNDDYVYWAFKYTYDALEAQQPGSAKGKLYYNDYGETYKVDRIIPLLDAVRARGVPVDGVGLQSHHGLETPTVAELDSTLEKFARAGYATKISELDVDVYPNNEATEVPCDDSLDQRVSKRYRELFDVFMKHKHELTSVTFWGVSDAQSWLDYYPTRRNNYPLLWNDANERKAAYYEVLAAAEAP
jgi:endo-1,4-beta-xylanase